MSQAEARIANNNPAADINPEQLRRALALADPNALRLTMYHLTRDPRLAEMEAAITPVWAGALLTYALDETHHEAVRDFAVEYLSANPHCGDDPELFSTDRIRETMELFGHGKLSDEAFRFGMEEAAFADFPRGVEWSGEQPDAAILAQYPVLIVGAGISGLAAAVHLQQLGIPYTIVERQDDLGGTWNFNSYPEARVDSSNMVYQYKFIKRYPWSEFFATGEETKSYLKHVARRFDVEDHIRFNTAVVGACWDDAAAIWSVDLESEGRTEKVEARFIISASGLFSTPKLPDIPGIEAFGGKVLHTTDWSDSDSADGKRIAQIGTGASGAQVMPYFARHADHVTVFQRTANWVLPMEGYRDAVPDDMQWLFDNVPLYWNWYSYSMHFLNTQLEGLQEFDPEWVRKGGTVNERNDLLGENVRAFIRDRLKDRPELIDKVIPDYPPLARRPTVDNGWYDALLKDNVDLVTEGIEKIESDAIVTVDGDRHPCDMIVCAAGFQTMRYMWPATYMGRAGATLDDLWTKDGPRAHLGMTLPGFPNFFVFFGPNSQGRAGSFYTMAEQWARYALKAIVRVVEGKAKSIEVTEAAYAASNQKLDEQNKSVIWEKLGKGFYYLTDEGRNVVNSPYRTVDVHSMLYEPDFAEYSIE